MFETDERDVEEISDYRLILELSAVEHACRIARPVYLAKLREALAELETALAASDHQRYCQADTRFHQLAFDHCDNSYLVEAHRLVSGRIAALRTAITAPLEATHLKSRSYQEHAEMLACLEENRLSEFSEAISAHIRGTKDVYHRALEVGRLPSRNVG